MFNLIEFVPLTYVIDIRLISLTRNIFRNLALSQGSFDHFRPLRQALKTLDVSANFVILIQKDNLVQK